MRTTFTRAYAKRTTATSSPRSNSRPPARQSAKRPDEINIDPARRRIRARPLVDRNCNKRGNGQHRKRSSAMPIRRQGAGSSTGKAVPATQSGHQCRPQHDGRRRVAVAMRKDHAARAAIPACMPKAYAMPVAVAPMIGGPSRSARGRSRRARICIDDEASPDECTGNGPDRERMSERASNR